MRTRLFIEGEEIELKQDLELNLTTTFSDLVNPTKITTDWSKTINIPFTARNNKIFSNIYRPDWIKANREEIPDNIFRASNIVEMSEDFVEKTLISTRTDNVNEDYNFAELQTLLNGQKVATIRRLDTEGKFSFMITKFSGLPVFDTLRFIVSGDTSISMFDFEFNDEDSGDFYFTGEILKNDPIPANSFRFKHMVCTKDRYVDWEEYKVSEDIGLYFNPYKRLKFQVRYGDELVFQGYAKLLDITRNGLNNGTYNISLNGELGNVFKMASSIQMEDSADKDTFLNYNPNTESSYVSGTINRALIYNNWTYGEQKHYDINDEDISIHDIIGFTPNNSKVSWFDHTSLLYDTTYKPYGQAALDDCLGFTNIGNWMESIRNYVPAYSDVSINNINYYKNNGMLPSDIGDFRSYLQIPYIYLNKFFQIFIEKLKVLSNCSIELDRRWFNEDNPYWYNTAILLQLNENLRSGDNFTLQTYWNNEVKPFSLILNYTKMFNILWVFDSATNTLRLVQRDHYYFDNNRVFNWDEKVDNGQSITIKPISFDKKYVKLNYKDSDTKYNQLYKDKNGVGYGEGKLITEYNFNTEEEDFITDPSFEPPLVYSPNMFCFQGFIFDRGGFSRYMQSNNIFVDCNDSDSNYISKFGTLYFVRPSINFWKDELITPKIRPDYISDDVPITQSQGIQPDQDQQTYCYNFFELESLLPQTVIKNYITLVNTYNALDFVYVNKNKNAIGNPDVSYLPLLTLKRPNTFYKEDPEVTNIQLANKSKDIYELFWQKTLNDKYDINNKVITTNIVLNPQDYKNITDASFIKYGNRYCKVSKIYDYNFSNALPTKVDLCTIKNRSNYVNFEGYIYFSTDCRGTILRNQQGIPQYIRFDFNIKTNGYWILDTTIQELLQNGIQFIGTPITSGFGDTTLMFTTIELHPEILNVPYCYLDFTVYQDIPGVSQNMQGKLIVENEPIKI